jgi:hypothetical protein
MKVLYIILFFLSSCCFKPMFDVYKFPDNSLRIGCETIHRCKWVAEQMCGAAGYKIIKQVRTGSRAFILPPGFIFDGSWEIILVVECGFRKR